MEILNQEMKELQEQISILKKSNSDLETEGVSLVKAAKKRKGIQVMIYEETARIRKSDEQTGT